MHQMPANREAFEAEVIATAEYFTAFCRRARADRVREQFPTQAEAEARATQMANTFGQAGLVYAVTGAGRSTLVSTFQPQRS